jgi:hypothetical protein
MTSSLWSLFLRKLLQDRVNSSQFFPVPPASPASCLLLFLTHSLLLEYSNLVVVFIVSKEECCLNSRNSKLYQKFIHFGEKDSKEQKQKN